MKYTILTFFAALLLSSCGHDEPADEPIEVPIVNAPTDEWGQ